MTREEAKAILKGFMENPLFSDIPKVCRAFDMAIKALEQESCNTPRNDLATTSQDCISREAVLMELGKYLCGVPYEKGINVVIKELPPVTPQPKTGQWIPVSERLPKDNGYYLTTTVYHEVYCDYWEEERFNRTETVIAWMSLPEPYEPTN